MRPLLNIFERNADIVLQGLTSLPCRVIRNKDSLTIEAENGYGIKANNNTENDITEIDFFDPDDRNLGFEEKSNQILLAVFVDLLMVPDLAQAVYVGEKDLNDKLYKVYKVEINNNVFYEFYMEIDYQLKAICKVSDGFSLVENSFIIFKE